MNKGIVFKLNSVGWGKNNNKIQSYWDSWRSLRTLEISDYKYVCMIKGTHVSAYLGTTFCRISLSLLSHTNGTKRNTGHNK